MDGQTLLASQIMLGVAFFVSLLAVVLGMTIAWHLERLRIESDMAAQMAQMRQQFSSEKADLLRRIKQLEAANDALREALSNVMSEMRRLNPSVQVNMDGQAAATGNTMVGGDQVNVSLGANQGGTSKTMTGRLNLSMDGPASGNTIVGGDQTNTHINNIGASQ